MDAPLDYAQDGAIVTLTLNAPDIRNAISGADMIDALVQACERMNADMSVRAAILTGAGSAFSSGGNVKKMADGGGLGGGLPAQTRRNYKLGIQRIPLAFDRLEVPIIAAVNGPAIGAGCDLACMCDVRIAAESAKFAESFVKLGIIPGDGGAWLLPRVVGYSKACEMAFTGDMLSAAEALACGLVSKVVPDADAAGRGAQAGRAHRRQPAARGAHDQAADPRRPARAARHAAGTVRRHAIARACHRGPQGSGGGVP